MPKPYTWNEIKLFFEKELKKTRHIMTFGIIGSCNLDHDIDIIITKKPTSSSSNFYKEIHKIYDNLNKYLKNNYKCKVIRFATASEQFSLMNSANYEKNDLLLHTMIYFSYPQMEKDWAPALVGSDNIKDILINNYEIIFGDIKNIFISKFQNKQYYGSIFNMLYLYDKINSNVSENLLLISMNHYFDYLYRKRLGLKPPIAKNEKEVRKYFYQLCDILDKLESKKTIK